MNDRWQDGVLEHGPLVPVVDGVWIVEGSLKRGPPIPRTMVIARLPGGGLWIHSAVALREESMQELERLGKPEVLVVPNPGHRLDAPRYKKRYPNLRVFAPRVARKAVEKLVPIDGDCESAMAAFGIEARQPDGTNGKELAYLVPTPYGKVLVVADLLFNLAHRKGVQGFILKTIGSTGFFGVTNVGKLLLVQDKKALSRWLVSLTHEKLAAISVGHGALVSSDCSGKLRDAAQRLSPGNP